MSTLLAPIDEYTKCFTQISALNNINMSNASPYNKRFKPAVTSTPLLKAYVSQTKTRQRLTKGFGG